MVWPSGSTWLARSAVAAAVVVSLGIGGCGFVLPASAPPARPKDELGVAVSLSAAPARRLVFTPDENQSRSRVLAVWLRAENTANDRLTFDPRAVTLTFADGSAGTTLDRDQVSLLLDRAHVAPTDEAAADYPDLWSRASWQQSALKRQLSDGLLTERSLGSEPIEGYLFFDTKQPAAPVSNAVLTVSLVRDSDGATLRQVYHFGGQPPSPVAKTE